MGSRRHEVAADLHDDQRGERDRLPAADHFVESLPAQALVAVGPVAEGKEEVRGHDVVVDGQVEVEHELRADRYGHAQEQVGVCEEFPVDNVHLV